MTLHRIGCASLERRAQCTCGADKAPPMAWGRIVLIVLAVAAVAVWIVW